MSKAARVSLAALCVLPLLGAAQSIDPLQGGRVSIDPSQPPAGEQLVQLFLENASVPLKGSGCAASAAVDRRTLREMLAVALGSSLRRPDHKTELKAQCIDEDFEGTRKSIVKGWACALEVTETDAAGEYVSNSSIKAGFTKDTWRLIPGSLICL